MFTAALFLVALTSSPENTASQIPPAIYTDPVADKAHPTRMEVLHIPSGDVQINGVAYLAAGAGPHPTIIICHGLPGNEKNLDLAQALRRAGWNAITFNYRGSWGSPGSFRFDQNPKDASAVLAYLRVPANAQKLGIDTSRVVIAGHSMGGWAAAMSAANDHGLDGIILISAANIGAVGRLPTDAIAAVMADSMESLAGTTPSILSEEVRTNAEAYDFVHKATSLAKIPMLVLSSDDGLAPHTDALATAIDRSGGKQVTSVHVATDHSWSDRRIRMQTDILRWLAKLK
jgi:uncharacterized protein